MSSPCRICETKRRIPERYFALRWGLGRSLIIVAVGHTYLW
jgi:hypothetical protein